MRKERGATRGCAARLEKGTRPWTRKIHQTLEFEDARAVAWIKFKASSV